VRADDPGAPTERNPGVAEAPRRGSAAPAGALSDVADFLRLYAPFDALLPTARLDARTPETLRGLSRANERLVALTSYGPHLLAEP
jgi:hypothetical protein